MLTASSFVSTVSCGVISSRAGITTNVRVKSVRKLALVRAFHALKGLDVGGLRRKRVVSRRRGREGTSRVRSVERGHRGNRPAVPRQD